jgi:hypothetical protein
MKKKTIVYISFEPLNQRYIDRFCLDYFIEKGYKIYHLDISLLFFTELNMNQKSKEYSFIFNDYKQLSDFFNVKKLFNCITVCTFGIPNKKNMKIYHLLKSYDSKLVYFDDGRLPGLPLQFSLLGKLKALFNPNKVINKIVELSNKVINRDIKFDYVFTSGEISAKIFAASKPYRINNLDNNRYLKSATKNIPSDKKYIIFIDQNMVSHPDFIIMGNLKIDENSYYKKLNNFLSKVEKQFNTQILIATHPTADYLNNPFENRKLISGNETAEKMINCDFVITFFSTAINYAILKYKPVLFINSKVVSTALPEPESSLCSKDFAKRLDQALIDIDNITNEIIINRNIDKSKYDKYKYNYIVSKGYENTLNEKLIENVFKKIK